MRLNALAILLALTCAALAGCANPAVRDGEDADRDGLSDAEEVAGWMVTVTTPAGTRSYHVTSDPSVADTDGDGLGDAHELIFGADPRRVDTDADGLTDCQEKRFRNLLACQAAGNPDGEPGYGTNANHWDFDGDGLSDGEEVNRHHSNPLALDSDQDGLNDNDEVRLGASPTDPDSDDDGCRDGVDALPTFEQRFAPGLVTVRLPSGESYLQFILADALMRVPASGTFQATGAAQDGAPLEPVPATPTSCGISPRDPWATIQIAASRSDGSSFDVTSLNPGGADRAYWNLATGNVSWSRGGPALATPLVWSGADGEVRFAPQVVRPS